METAFLVLVIALFVLAVFDLMVGVSNDAVNFLNSAIGSKAAPFWGIMLVAAVGVFVGASTSNGMMDIARHGVFHPQYFSLNDLMCIFLAVMLTDVILLDVFNSMGMPTSTTVSMVFELLGGAFMIALLKLVGEPGLDLGSVLNTEKALTMIMGIFISVAIAFFFGLLVQYITRLLFSFQYKKNMKWFGGLFGGISLTAIVYFVLIKGAKNMTIMTPDVKDWIHDNTLMLVMACFVGFTVLMQLLHILKVNVLKIVVLAGTFALALAFAGNDLVNFVGVPLAGYSSYIDYVNNGAGVAPDQYMMGVLNEPAATPLIFLLASGAIMVYSLLTSKKAHNVIKTSLDLSRQEEGEEMFGSSRLARGIVRGSMNLSATLDNIMPDSMKNWIEKRFNTDEMEMEEGAAFDLLRASVNLVLAGLLIALGTSLKLPLSTTYVTFMVAMGSSLADRAWARESAVFRVTGVISVIGGWFMTAGVAFAACALMALLFYYGGMIAMFVMMAVVIVILIRNQVTFRKKKQAEQVDEAFTVMVRSNDPAEVWNFLNAHYAKYASELLDEAGSIYDMLIKGFMTEDIRTLRKAAHKVDLEKDNIKKYRHRELLGLRRCDQAISMEKTTWFHLAYNSLEQLRYGLKRIVEPCKEHVDNNFNPLPEEWKSEYAHVSEKINELTLQISSMIKNSDYTNSMATTQECEAVSRQLSQLRDLQLERLRKGEGSMHVTYLYLNLIQESQQFVSGIKHLLRASRRFSHHA